MLFTAVGRRRKYKFKSCIDTIVYRRGDAASGSPFAGLSALGPSLPGIAFVAMPLAADRLGTGQKKQETLRVAARPEVTAHARL